MRQASSPMCARCLRPGDALLLGTDLEKPVAQLLSAYDDPAGVTAAFNLNLLARINRELDADFDLRALRPRGPLRPRRAPHRDAPARARAGNRLRSAAAEIRVELAACETILTESSHKFGAAEVDAMARRAGFLLEAQWVDAEWPFAETLLVAGT